MKETVVERRLIKRVRDAGGKCMKFMPVVRGYPDRLVMFPPDGRLYLVETKAPNGKLRPAQVAFIQQAKAIGHEVAVLYTTQQVDAWVDARIAERDLL